MGQPSRRLDQHLANARSSLRSWVLLAVVVAAASCSTTAAANAAINPDTPTGLATETATSARPSRLAGEAADASSAADRSTGEASRHLAARPPVRIAKKVSLHHQPVPRRHNAPHRRTGPSRPAGPAQKARMPVARSDAHEIIASARRSDSNTPGYCLQWTREQADIPAGFPDAATAWRHAAGKHSGDRTPPAGAAVYWTGGSRGFGHIAISLGDGRVRSTDAGGAGQVSTVKVGWVSKEWGLRYAGWSNSINGYVIPGVPD